MTRMLSQSSDVTWRATPAGLQRQNPRQWHRDQPAQGQKHLQLRSNNVDMYGHVWTCSQCSQCSVVGKGSMHYDELRILRTLRSHNCFTRVSELFHREPTHRRRVLLQSSCSVPLYLGIWNFAQHPGCKPRKALDRAVDYHRTAMQNK